MHTHAIITQTSCICDRNYRLFLLTNFTVAHRKCLFYHHRAISYLASAFPKIISFCSHCSRMIYSCSFHHMRRVSNFVITCFCGVSLVFGDEKVTVNSRNNLPSSLTFKKQPSGIVYLFTIITTLN